MRMRRLLAWVLPFAALGGEPATAPMPAALGVQIEKPAGDGVHFSIGSGVYLGNGVVLTAAHVVTVNPANRSVSVILDGWKVDAAIKSVARNDLDLALLQIPAESLSLLRQTQKPLSVCDNDPIPNQNVAVAAEGKVTLAVAAGSDVLAAGFHQGSSGGGVIDPVRGCLWGIVRLEMSNGSLDLTAFVPARQITGFLAQP